MKKLPQTGVVRSAAGNGEERSAQIRKIQARLDRLSRVHETMTTEIASLNDELHQLDGSQPAGPISPDKESN